MILTVGDIVSNGDPAGMEVVAQDMSLSELIPVLSGTDGVAVGMADLGRAKLATDRAMVRDIGVPDRIGLCCIGLEIGCVRGRLIAVYGRNRVLGREHEQLGYRLDLGADGSFHGLRVRRLGCLFGTRQTGDHANTRLAANDPCIRLFAANSDLVRIWHDSGPCLVETLCLPANGLQYDP